MSFYIPECKAMYLCPNRLEALHGRKGLKDETGESCVICRLSQGKMTWLDFACMAASGVGPLTTGLQALDSLAREFL